MKNNLLRGFAVGLAVIMFSVLAFAQEQRETVNAASSLYVISAKAGVVNFVEGKVNVARKNAVSGLLLKGDELEVGDVVSTGADGRAEILLNPGSFVRLADNSTFEFTTTSLDDLRLKLSGGSAMFEVITDDEFNFAVNTPKAAFNIVKSGVYRVNVLADGTGVIEVWKGRATANGVDVKSGKQATISGTQTTIAKFDRDDKDALEIWSKERAKQLARINARLQNETVRTSLMSSYFRTRWSLSESYGLWIYSRLHGSYCFMPFGYGWSSPYGYSYRRDIWYYNLPPVIYNPPPPPATTNSTLVSAGTIVRGGRTGARGSSSEGETTRTLAPYQRVQKDIGQFPAESAADGSFAPDLASPARTRSSSSPSSSAPSSSSSAPASTVSSPSTETTKKDN